MYEDLINRLRYWKDQCDRTNFGCLARKTIKEAADSLEKLQAELEQAKRERDAAIVDLKMLASCSACKYYNRPEMWGKCKACEWDNNWQWRGAKGDKT